MKINSVHFQCIAAIQHVELRLGREFTKEEFKAGSVGGFMIPDDFDPKITVSYQWPHSPIFQSKIVIVFKLTHSSITEKKYNLTL